MGSPTINKRLTVSYSFEFTFNVLTPTRIKLEVPVESKNSPENTLKMTGYQNTIN